MLKTISHSQRHRRGSARAVTCSREEGSVGGACGRLMFVSEGDESASYISFREEGVRIRSLKREFRKGGRGETD